MANPNIVNVATINGGSLGFHLTTTTTTTLMTVSSDVIIKINSILVANVDGTNAATVTVSISTDNGSSYHAIASTVSVPADATLVVIDRNSALYLDETDLIRVVGSANSDLTYTVSGEKITD